MKLGFTPRATANLIEIADYIHARKINIGKLTRVFLSRERLPLLIVKST